MQFKYKKQKLFFKKNIVNSMFIFKETLVYTIIVKNNDKTGISQSCFINNSDFKNQSKYENMLNYLSKNIHKEREELINKSKCFAPMRFAIENAFKSLDSKNIFEIYPSAFTQSKEGLKVNGLVSIIDCQKDLKYIKEILKNGYDQIKIKIGILDFAEEINILKNIRKVFDKEYLKISLDANGNLGMKNIIKKIDLLYKLNISTLEQPIAPNNYKDINHILENSPLEIALDEDLIFCDKKEDIFDNIKPCKIIIKPTLLGGFNNCKEWIRLADKHKWNWSITSSLESNIALSQVAQWAYKFAKDKTHGLSTIDIYNNDTESLLKLKDGRIYFESNMKNLNTLK